MRDAFGGAFMIKLLIIFIVVYIGFIAIALNYAKAFKVKNKVIEYIEENEITDISNMTAKAYTEMQQYFQTNIVEQMDYKVSIKCPERNAYCQDGIVIVESSTLDSNKEGKYYTVTTYFGWEIPFLNILLRQNDQDGETISGLWKISGETRTIVNKA